MPPQATTPCHTSPIIFATNSNRARAMPYPCQQRQSNPFPSIRSHWPPAPTNPMPTKPPNAHVQKSKRARSPRTTREAQPDQERPHHAASKALLHACANACDCVSHAFSPAPAQSGNRTTRSPSLYSSPLEPLVYELSRFWSTIAMRERMVGCHWTMCSC